MAIFKGISGRFMAATPFSSPQTPLDAAIATTAGIGQITEWSISGGPNVADVTELGDTWMERVTTIKSFSGSASGYIDATSTGTINQREILGRIITTGVSSTLSTGSGNLEGLIAALFVLQSTTAAFFGNVVPSFEITGNVGGIFTVNFTFTGAGGLEYDSDIAKI